MENTEESVSTNSKFRVLRALFSVAVFFVPAPEVLCTLGPNPSSYSAYQDQRPTGDAMQLVGRVTAALKPVCSPHCATVTIFRNATAPNVILLFDSDHLKMAYSPEFFTTIYEKYGDAAIIAVIAHMLGHAVGLTTRAQWLKGSWTPELSADAWAGCTLSKVGLNPTGLQSALKTLSMYPFPSQSDWSLRIPALRAGYTGCGGDGAKFDISADRIKK